MQNSRTRA